MDYAYNEATTQKAYHANEQVLGRATEVKAFDRCVTDANNIREQVAEVSKIADAILSRLAGSRPEDGAEGNGAKDPLNGGAIGELVRIQSGTFAFLTDLRRTLEQIGKYV